MIVLIDAGFADIAVKSSCRARSDAVHAQRGNWIVMDVKLIFSFNNRFWTRQKRTEKKQSNEKQQTLCNKYTEIKGKASKNNENKQHINENEGCRKRITSVFRAILHFNVADEFQII